MTMFVLLIAAATLGWVKGTPPDNCTPSPPYLCYSAHAGPVTFDAAYAACRDLGSGCTLASPRNPDQNSLLADVLGNASYRFAFIGIHRETPGGADWEIYLPDPPGRPFDRASWLGFLGGVSPTSFSDVDCVHINTHLSSKDERWTVASCNSAQPYSCQCPYDYDEVCGDPHFLLHMRGSSLPVCFDYQGHNNDIVQMIHDPDNGLTVNAVLITVGTKEHTYFQSLSVLTKDCTVYVNMYGITVQSNEIPWEQHDTTSCGSLSYMINKKKHVIITTETGVQLRFSKKTNIPHLDFYIGEGQGLSAKTHGVLGQLENLEVKVMGYADGPVNEVGVMSFPNSPNRKDIKVMKKFRTSQRVACWHVGHGGGALMIGEEKDYLVPNLEFNQLAEGLRRPKGVNIL